MQSCIWSTQVNEQSKTYYPVRLQARYRSLERYSDIAGVGTTLAMSSSSLLVTGPHEVPFGLRLEIQLDWPSLLEATIPLMLVVTGRVSRSEPSLFGVEFTTYQFRTMKRSSLQRQSAFQQSA